MSPMSVRTRIFLRTVGLLVVLVAAICIVTIAFMRSTHRKLNIDSGKIASRVLAPRVERLILWNDRLALEDLLAHTVETHPLVEYAFVAVDDRPYVDTFEKGVPRGLLKRRRAVTDVPAIVEVQDRRGRFSYDLAMVVGPSKGVLHLGLSRRAIDHELQGHTRNVVLLGLTALVFGTFAAAGITHRVTVEMDRLTGTLKRSEAKHRILFESSRDAIMTLAPPSWKFTSGNPATVEMFGTKDEAEFVSLGPWELSPEFQPEGRASSEKAKEMIETAMTEGSNFFEWQHRRFGGPEFPATVLLTRVELDDQVFLQATVRDISEQKRAERSQQRFLQLLEEVNRLQEELIVPGRTEEKCKKITDTAVDVLDLDSCRIWVTRPADLCEAGCIHANVAEGPHVCRDREKCLHLVSSSGRYIDIDGDHRRVPLGAHKIGRVAAGDDTKFLTNQVTTDPRVHNHQWAGQLGLTSFAGYKLRVGNEGPAGVLAAFSKHPITREEDSLLSGLAETTSLVILGAEAERELHEAKDRAEAATRAKSCFLANMSHEIRTPMTAILGFTDALLDELKEPEALEAARVVKRNGERLLELINDILDISKIEAGKMTFEKIPWSPRQIVTEVVSLLHARAQAKGLTLKDEYVGALPETIVTDPTRLRQILMNVVGNAIKFTETGGVRIVTRLAKGGGDEPKLRFDVIDTGVGIPDEEIGNVFEAFSQADGSVTRQYGGTGLGLTISRQLARLLGGDVTATSDLGNGSTFTVIVATGPLERVPLVDHAMEAAPSSDDRNTSTGEDERKLRCRILLAEDIPDNQRLIGVVLRRAGAEVTIVQDGQQALEKALATRPRWGKRYSDPEEAFDVVLMDMQMPVLDGYGATRRLRKEGYSGPIIALTAHAMRGDRQKCLDAGCDDYETKPIHPEKLVETVAKWAGGQQSPERAAGNERGGEGAKGDRPTVLFSGQSRATEGDPRVASLRGEEP